MAEWHEWHSGRKLLNASDPPCALGVMWSTSVATTTRPGWRRSGSTHSGWRARNMARTRRHLAPYPRAAA